MVLAASCIIDTHLRTAERPTVPVRGWTRLPSVPCSAVSEPYFGVSRSVVSIMAVVGDVCGTAWSSNSSRPVDCTGSHGDGARFVAFLRSPVLRCPRVVPDGVRTRGVGPQGVGAERVTSQTAQHKAEISQEQEEIMTVITLTLASRESTSADFVDDFFTVVSNGGKIRSFSVGKW